MSEYTTITFRPNWQLPAKLDRLTARQGDRIKWLLLRGIKTACPVNFGLLRNSLTGQQVAPGLWKVGIFQEASGFIEQTRQKMRAKIVADTGMEPGTVFHYAQIVHQGRGPVRAKRAKCLHFLVPETARYFYSGDVMTRAVFKAEPVLGKRKVLTGGMEQGVRGMRRATKTIKRSRFRDVFVKSVGPAPAHPFIPWGMAMAKPAITGYLSTQAGALDKA